VGIKRKQHSAEFKARVAMAAFLGQKTVAALSAELISFSGSYVTLCWRDSNPRSPLAKERVPSAEWERRRRRGDPRRR
jgi:transposase-like protein